MKLLASTAVVVWLLGGSVMGEDRPHSQGVGAGENAAQQVARVPGLVAFWDFNRVENNQWVSVSDAKTTDRAFPIVLRKIGDPKGYRLNEWPHTDAESQLRIEEGGPFGKAVRFNKGYIFGEVPRAAFDKTLLDISGRQPFTLVSWVKFTGERHLIAGVWDEGGWDKYGGRRQYALFGGLFGTNGVTAHVSATGAASYPQSNAAGAQYARLKALDGGTFENNEWVCVAMVYDPAKREVSAFLNGVQTPFEYGDNVVQDVFGHRNKEPLNPVTFEWPLFSPRAFTLKFNGYNIASGGVAEHWIFLDTEENRITYGRSPAESAKDKKFRVAVDIQRQHKSLLAGPLSFDATPDATVHYPTTVKTQPGDVVIASLLEQDGTEWKRVGGELNKTLQEGAPFTFGRALGLGEEELEHGSVLTMGGVAAFNRPLTAAELRSIVFVRGGGK